MDTLRESGMDMQYCNARSMAKTDATSSFNILPEKIKQKMDKAITLFHQHGHALHGICEITHKIHDHRTDDRGAILIHTFTDTGLDISDEA